MSPSASRGGLGVVDSSGRAETWNEDPGSRKCTSGRRSMFSMVAARVISNKLKHSDCVQLTICPFDLVIDVLRFNVIHWVVEADCFPTIA